MRHVLREEFSLFEKETGYVCSVDLQEGKGSLESHTRSSYGREKNLPMLRLSFRDAMAYSEWAKVAIPSEEELRRFFLESIAIQKFIKWTCFCWTNTWEGEKIVVLRGGYLTCAGVHGEKRKLVPPNYLDDFELMTLIVAEPNFKAIRQFNPTPRLQENETDFGFATIKHPFCAVVTALNPDQAFAVLRESISLNAQKDIQWLYGHSATVTMESIAHGYVLREAADVSRDEKMPIQKCLQVFLNSQMEARYCMILPVPNARNEWCVLGHCVDD